MPFNSKIMLFIALSLLTISINSASASASERSEKIIQAGQIRVCIWPDYFAISYRNPRTGQLEGIDIDMAHELADSMGVGLQFVESSFSKLVSNLKNDACDIAMHGVGIRDSRKPFMEFSQPYLASGIYAVGTKDNTGISRWEDIDRTGVVVVVQKGTYMEPVVKQTFKYASVSVVDSFKAREQEVLSGRADVFMTDYPYGKRMAALTQWAVLMAPKKPLAKTYYAYAVPKGEIDWLKEVDDFLKAMKKSNKLYQSAVRNGLSEIVVTD
ncbi:amino acid ABC transporter substrate-binding protein, PAAT family [Amphritea atlantica]|uniref:Amino acid ABC transporter substrate-binding protein, PAAT family n=2 Tax=Amphritea atlantica TaxID=355243 RepID=A0A1H9FYT0_9GAMM|nr:amino acid ABC transporter substrate-binding protein, PAAT family [Amphritea atlantica]